MKIGIAFDLAPAEPVHGDGPDDQFEEFDQPATVEAIADVLCAGGHEVVLLGNGRAFLERVLADPPEFVFNIAEGQGVGRNREARVPAVLEMLEIPYSGSDPLTLAATLDKGVARTLVRAAGVVVPDGVVVPPGADREDLAAAFSSLQPGGDMRPLIVKPLAEGSSKGIREQKSLVDSWDDFITTIGALHAAYAQPALVEEYIAGDELTVGILGNGDDAVVLGVMRVVPRTADPRFVYSIEVKRDWRRRVEYEAPAVLSTTDRAEVAAAALRAYHALGCRDVARIDLRLRDGVPYFLEANPLPGLSPETGDLVLLARGHGLDHAGLIRRILAAACARHGLGCIRPATGLD